MDKRYPSDMQPPAYDPYEDEIELMDLLKVLWKWKYLILIGTLVCAVAAAVVSLNMTKVYGITTVLQPGMLKVTEDGKTVYIDSPENIKAVIETGALNGQVLKNVQFPDTEEQPTSVEFKVTIPKNTNALEVVYETPYVDIGLQIMKNLNEGLLERYNRIIKLYRETYEDDIRQKEKNVFAMNEKIAKLKNDISGAEAETAATIKKLNNQKSTLEAQIEAKKNQIKGLEQRIAEVESEIGRISKNSDLLISERNKFLGSKQTEHNILSAVIYSNTIQQNISYLNDLRSTINSTKSQIYETQSAIESLTNKIKDLAVQVENLKEQTRLKNESLASEVLAFENERKNILIDIQSLNFKKSQIENIQINKAPRRSESPVKPKTRLNVMLAGVVGLFLTVFLSFFVEYISKYRNRESDE
ncbi:MAG: hypothetical protein QG552_1840 [Thermodesulfobacteriota bacterium]|nr:hypothetical protein [Thermodesulfobacteriota bacterium]